MKQATASTDWPAISQFLARHKIPQFCFARPTLSSPVPASALNDEGAKSTWLDPWQTELQCRHHPDLWTLHLWHQSESMSSTVTWSIKWQDGLAWEPEHTTEVARKKAHICFPILILDAVTFKIPCGGLVSDERNATFLQPRHCIQLVSWQNGMQLCYLQTLSEQVDYTHTAAMMASTVGLLEVNLNRCSHPCLWSSGWRSTNMLSGTDRIDDSGW